MYICYLKDRQDLGFLCTQDIKDAKQITLILGVVSITIIIVTNSILFVPSGDLINQSYSNKPSYEKVISDDVSSMDLINKLRSGGDDLPENADQNSEKVNEILKESVRFEKLQKSVVSKSGEDSGNLSDRSFNKIVVGVLDKLEPIIGIIGNPKFLRVLTETQKPVKSELTISMEGSSKAILDPKPQKPSAKRSPSIFAEALAPVNPHRWAAFTAGSSMANNMPDLQDKVQTPWCNVVVAKEYLETSKSDLQWRYRFWKVTKDTATINIASEIGGDVGAFAAGAISNKIADGYMEEMFMSEVNMGPQEKLNMEIFKQTARERGIPTSEVRGTGVMREFVPEFMREDICERPAEDVHPTSWTETDYPFEDGSSFN